MKFETNAQKCKRFEEAIQFIVTELVNAKMCSENVEIAIEELTDAGMNLGEASKHLDAPTNT
jgi:hypothetical protein